jgi:HK97 family phage prohead protease
MPSRRVPSGPIRRIAYPRAVKFAGTTELGAARQVMAIVSSEEPDRMGDVVQQDGIDYSAFLRGGGTVLWQHDVNYPVARTLHMGVVAGSLMATAQFPPEGTSAQSDECFRLIREGVVNQTSIGFIPVDWEYMDNRAGGILFRKVELLEFSYVSVAANRDAVIVGKAYRSTEFRGPTPCLPIPLDYVGTKAQRDSLFEHLHPHLALERALAAAETPEDRMAVVDLLRRQAARRVRS